MFLRFINYNQKFIYKYFEKVVFLIKVITNNINVSLKRKKCVVCKELQKTYIQKLVLKKFNIKNLIRIKTNI